MNSHITPVVKNLLIINILFFIGMYLLGDRINMTEHLAVFYFASPFFKIWQPITYMFMHGSVMHILFNMFALFSFGPILEMKWGAKRFLNFYLITGLGALAMQWGVQAFEVYQITGAITFPGNIQVSDEQLRTLQGIFFGPMVGASGAIFGLLIAFGMLYPDAELYIMFIPVPIKAKYIIPVYILIELSLGVAQVKGDSVAHYAHIGGALIGFIIVKIWAKKDRFYDYYE